MDYLNILSSLNVNLIEIMIASTGSTKLQQFFNSKKKNYNKLLDKNNILFVLINFSSIGLSLIWIKLH